MKLVNVYRLTSAICNSKQVWNEDRCRCECGKLANKGTCDKGYIWNPSNCGCECDKSCGIGQYLDYKSCVCRNSIVDKLVEECTNVIDKNEFYNETLNVTPLVIYCIICSIFNNNNWWFFCLFSLTFKKRYCSNALKK